MPNSQVILYLSNGQSITTRSDNLGYFSFLIRGLKAGKYTLYVKSEYNEKKSFSSVKGLQLTSLSLWGQFLEFLRNLWGRIVGFFSSLALGPLWLVIPIIILIIILIYKLWPEKFHVLFFNKRHHPLHHKWEFGY